MKTVVYADVYFLLNFSIDLICLAICGAIAGKPLVKKRLVIAAFLGGVYACIALFITLPVISVLSALVVCYAMYCISYAPSSVWGVIYGGVLLFCVNALFGGLYSAIVSVASGGRVDTDRFRYYPLFLTLAAVLIFIRILKFRSTGGVSVKLTYKNREAAFDSIIDTGNSLREPISGAGVAFIARDAAPRLFTENEIDLLNGSSDPVEAYERGFRYVLFGTAAGSKKCSCVKADRALVTVGSRKTEVSLYITVSSETFLGDTECLLPNSLNYLL